MGYFSQAHENTSEEIFFLLWNAPDCIKRDVQLHSKNTGLSEQSPLNPHTQKHLLKSLSYKSMQMRMKSIILWILTVQALGSAYTCSFLQFPLSFCTYPTTKSAPASLPSEGKVTAVFSPMEPCQLQILIKRLCDSTGDNIRLSPSEVKMLWKEFLHGCGSRPK